MRLEGGSEKRSAAMEADAAGLRTLAEQSNAWPFEEARKIVARLTQYPKDEVIFETGYGPSGLPHIGTFGEVARTTIVRHAFRVLTEDKECMAYDGGAGDFAERTDMRQARWAITGLEDHLVLGVLREPHHDLAGFLERPGVRLLRKRAQTRGIGFHGGTPFLRSAVLSHLERILIDWNHKRGVG